MNKRSWLVSIFLLGVFISISLSQSDSTKNTTPFNRYKQRTKSQLSREDSIWFNKWKGENNDTDKRILTSDGKLKIIDHASEPQFMEESKPLSFGAFSYYEKYKADKTVAFFKSSFLPGLGFYDIRDDSKMILFFLGGVGSAIAMITTKDQSAFTLYLVIHIGIRIYEFANLSSSINGYNENLRYQIQIKFNLK